jgi:hypothetical protein
LVWGVILLIRTRSARGTNLFNYTKRRNQNHQTTARPFAWSKDELTIFYFERRYTANYMCDCNNNKPFVVSLRRWSFPEHRKNDDVAHLPIIATNKRHLRNVVFIRTIIQREVALITASSPDSHIHLSLLCTCCSWSVTGMHVLEEKRRARGYKYRTLFLVCFSVFLII